MVVGVVGGGGSRGGPTHYMLQTISQGLTYLLTFCKLVQELPGENAREDPELENFEGLRFI